MFTKGFEKTSAKAAAKAATGLGHELKSSLKSFGAHLKANRSDYMKGATATGALGTAIGVNRKNKR